MDCIVIAAMDISPYATLPFPGGGTPVERVCSRVERLRSVLSDESPVYFLHHATMRSPLPDLPSWWHLITVSSKRAGELYQALDGALPKDVDQIVWIDFDAPLLDVDLSWYLLRLQTTSWCDYTFADGYPVGYGARIVRRDIIPALQSLSDSASLTWTREVLFDTLSVDINAFDIETEAAGEDYALLRAHFTVDTWVNYQLCARILEEGGEDPPLAPPPDPRRERFPDGARPALHALRSVIGVRRTLPAYYQVQVTDEVAQTPFYQPLRYDDGERAERTLIAAKPGQGNHMPLERWKHLLEEVTRVSKEAIVTIGYLGEPVLHPHFDRLIAYAERYPALRIYIESSGIGWSSNHFAAIDSPAVAAVIVELDAVDQRHYARMRGDDRFQEAYETVLQLSRVIPGRVYAQATRMVENEWELQDFYRHFDALEGVSPLIQKYNGYAGLLPDRRTSSIAPLKRGGCWHLMRDVVVRLDETVPRCMQDLWCEARRGNLFEMPLEGVWLAGAEEAREHEQGRVGAICERCDEYYTFNA